VKGIGASWSSAYTQQACAAISPGLTPYYVPTPSNGSRKPDR
jgi:hypothetical protein